MRPVRCRRHGMATLTAMALIVLVSVAVLAITALLSADAKRTTLSDAQAQLRQLLTAGAAAAQEKLAGADAVSQQEFAVPLPKGLADRDGAVAVSIGPASDGAVLVEVRAKLDARRASQTLRFTRGEHGWAIAEARLE